MPLGETACAQVLDRPPDLRGVTSRLSPRPPYPSSYRPGTLTVLTKVAGRRTECLFPAGAWFLLIFGLRDFRCGAAYRRDTKRVQYLLFISALREPTGFS